MPKRDSAARSRNDSTRSPTGEEARDLAAALEARDAAIAELEQTLAKHEAKIASLRDALDQAQFKTRILDQSYSTQLGEARRRATAAERLVAEQQTRIAELDARHTELEKELAEARTTLESFGPEAASIDEMLASFAVPQDQPLAHDPAGEVDPPADPQALEEMIAPEVMFAGKGK